MRCKECIVQFLFLFDLFPLTQFLRYKNSPMYRTLSSSITSIVILTIFYYLSSGSAIKLVNKQTVTWFGQVENFFEPKPSTLTFNTKSKFMFSIGIIGFDLNNATERYFDIELIQKQEINDTFTDLRTGLLEPCTVDHFSMTEKIRNNFDTMGMGRRLCPPLNYSFTMYGKQTSASWEYLQVRIKSCSNTTSAIPCVPQATIDNHIATIGQINAVLFYVNPLINPGSTDYLDYFVQDRNFITFSKIQGAYSTGFIQDYTIDTDQSLLPYSLSRKESGIIIPDLFQVVPYQKNNSSTKLASFYLTKSGIKTTYKRSFTKIDRWFAYVGGLIGTTVGFMIFMNKFVLMAFELDIASKFFKYRNEEVDFSNFNIFTFILFWMYKIGTWIGCFKEWKEMKRRLDCKTEMCKQLDVYLLLERFNFMEQAIDHLLNKDNISEKKFFQFECTKTLRMRRRKYRKLKNGYRPDARDSGGSDEKQSAVQVEHNEEIQKEKQFKIRPRRLEPIIFKQEEQNNYPTNTGKIEDWKDLKDKITDKDMSDVQLRQLDIPFDQGGDFSHQDENEVKIANISNDENEMRVLKVSALKSKKSSLMQNYKRDSFHFEQRTPPDQ